MIMGHITKYFACGRLGPYANRVDRFLDFLTPLSLSPSAIILKIVYQQPILQ